MADEYEEILAGTVALGYLDCTLLEYARGIKYYIDQEARKYNCDTHLVNMLRRAACVGWENIHMFKQPPNFSPADADQLVRLREIISAEIHRQCAHCKNGLGWTEDGRAHYGYEHQGVTGIVGCTASPALRKALGTQEGK